MTDSACRQASGGGGTANGLSPMQRLITFFPKCAIFGTMRTDVHHERQDDSTLAADAFGVGQRGARHGPLAALKDGKGSASATRSVGIRKRFPSFSDRHTRGPVTADIHREGAAFTNDN